MKIQDTIASEFDEFSVNYTRDMVQCVPHYLKLIDSFVEDLPEHFVPHHILDLGCGNGNITDQLLNSWPSAHYTLLDASPEMIGLCKQRFAAYDFNYRTSYFKEYDFPQASFDMITAGFSLHHCDAEEKRSLFRKIFNALKPGGIFGYSDLMIDKHSAAHRTFLKNWERFVLKSYPEAEKWEWIMEHYAEFDKPEDLDKQLMWLNEAGFKRVIPQVFDSYWVHLRAVKR